MNYRIFFVVLIAVAPICSAGDQEDFALKIEQLKSKQSAIEADMLQLRETLERDMYKYREYLTLCSSMWGADYEQYTEVSGKLYSVMQEGGDIEKFFKEQAPHVEDEGKQFWIIFVAYQILRSANSADRFMARLKDLLEVNRELHLFQQSITA